MLLLQPRRESGPPVGPMWRAGGAPERTKLFSIMAPGPGVDMAPFKVIVVGGGLAGALLANGLQNNNVDVTVYERDKKDSERAGYQIRLGDSAMLGFRACLRDQDITVIAKGFGQSSESGSTAPTIMSSRCEEILNLTAIPSYAKSFGISRALLHDILTEPLVQNGVLRHGNAFSRYEIVRGADGNEKVRAYFADSSFDDCDILIGADGSRSRVSRASPELSLPPKIELTAEKEVLPWSKCMNFLISCVEDPYLFSQRELRYTIPTEGTQNTEGSERDEGRASFFWVLSIPKTYSHFTDVTEIPDKFKFCLDFIQDWDPRFKQLLLTAAKDDGTADIYVAPLRASTKPSQNWRATLQRSVEPSKGHPRVWLIGDAMHTMQANRGQGANQALHDCAEVLPELLSLREAAKSGKAPSTEQVRQACARYENQMTERAFTWVKKSGGTSIVVSDIPFKIFPGTSGGPRNQRDRVLTRTQSLDMDGLFGKFLYYIVPSLTHDALEA